MPNQENMMFIRPVNCHYCIHGYNALGHMVGYAQQQGVWQITDIQQEQAVKNTVYTSIDQTDPFSFYGFGHGHNTRYTGDTEEDIFNTSECSKVNGRLVYLLSCLTANNLGPEMIRQGALAYAGFNISWTWLAETDEQEEFVYPDPYNDPYAYCFYESANELWKALVDGKSFDEAIQQSIAKYDEWIDYWYYDNPEDPASQDCIKWLAHDRDGLVGLDVCDVQTTQMDCETQGCYWYNNCCNSVPEFVPNGNQGKLIIAGVVIGLIGLGYFAYKSQQQQVIYQARAS